MRLVRATNSRKDNLYSNAPDKKATQRIHELLKDSMRSPFAGIGKPEPLRFALSGFWSRRITEEHRMVYRVQGDDLEIVQLRYHY